MNDARTARRAVADEVASLMGRRRTKQTQLANATGMGQSYLSRRLAGLQPFTVDDLDAIAEFFDVPLSALIPPKVGSAGANSECVTADRTNSLIAV
jgi:transcriptional regulator with XRE-family HTH domain